MQVHDVEDPSDPDDDGGCPEVTWETPPDELLEPADLTRADQEGRLIAPLRQLARAAQPSAALQQAAIALAIADAEQASGTGGARSAAQPRHGYTVDPAIYWRACADLAVTGTGSYANLRASPISIAALRAVALSAIEDRLEAEGLTRTSTQLESVFTRVLDRAYGVAWAIRGPRPWRAEHRSAFEWIAVSSEDDPAHAPVNVHSADHPQHRVTIDIDRRSHTLRYAVYSPLRPEIQQTPELPLRTLPVDQRPTIPENAEVVLFLHGHGSRLEEFDSIAPHFFDRARDADRTYCVIAFDLPGRGYSTHFAHDYLGTSIERYRAHGLDMLDEAIVKFVDAIDDLVPIKDRLVAVIGGSLGGNLGLRMAEKLGSRVWPRSIVSWSPASTGNSMFRVGEGQELAHGPLGDLAFNTEATSLLPVHPGRRHEFFRWVFDKTIAGVEKPSSATWYRDDWPCRTTSIAASRMEMREVYSANYRRWHWRLAAEQRGWSHRDSDNRRAFFEGPTIPRYQQIRRRMLLLTGAQDNLPYVRTHGATRSMAEDMDDAPGHCRSFHDTGHSIHAERPRMLARQIVGFIDVDPCSNDEGFLHPRYYTGLRVGRFGTEANESILARTEFGFRLCVRDATDRPWRVRTQGNPPPNRRFWDGHPTTMVYDIDGDGRDELMARGRDAMWSFRVEPGNGDINIHGRSPRLSEAQLAGADNEANLTIRFGRLERRGPAIAVVRGPMGVLTLQYQPSSHTFEELGVTPIFTDAQGWDDSIYFRSISLVDDGTGAHVLVGRGPGGVQIYQFNTSTARWENATQSLILHGDAWDHRQYAETLRFGRIGSRRVLVARGADGVHTFELRRTGPAPRRPTLWAQLGPVSPHLTDAQGYDERRYYRTFALADVDGDGADELIIRGAAGLYTFRFDEQEGWVDPVLSPTLTDAEGWDRIEHFETFRYARLDGRTLHLIARAARGLKVLRFDPATRHWAGVDPR